VKRIKIAGQWVGEGEPVYLVAEIGGNFQDFPTAVKLIDLAKASGVHAVKLQHYRADTLASRKAMFDMENTGVISQYELFKKYELSDALTGKIVAYCREKQIPVFSTPSHSTDVNQLRKYDLPVYKIGSDDAVNIPFLRYVAKEGKPMIVSTGMCTMEEIQRSVNAILEEGNDQIILLHCVSNYPAHIKDVNLKAMQAMQAHFDFPVGYSDHTLGIDACYTAAALGASLLEFHFTYDKKAPGPDHMLSKANEETVALVKRLQELYAMMGDGVKHPASSEEKNRRNNRKSLVLTQNVKAGEKISPENIDIKRPGYGIPPQDYSRALGKVAKRDLKADDILNWDDLSIP